MKPQLGGAEGRCGLLASSVERPWPVMGTIFACVGNEFDGTPFVGGTGLAQILEWSAFVYM